MLENVYRKKSTRKDKKIKACSNNNPFKTVCTNLMVQASHIPGHEIRIVSYTLWDGGNCQLYKADYVVYILMHLPPN